MALVSGTRPQKVGVCTCPARHTSHRILRDSRAMPSSCRTAITFVAFLRSVIAPATLAVADCSTRMNFTGSPEPLVLTNAPAGAAAVIPAHANAFALLNEDTTGGKVEEVAAAPDKGRQLATTAGGHARIDMAANKGAGQLLCCSAWQVANLLSLCWQFLQQWPCQYKQPSGCPAG